MVNDQLVNLNVPRLKEIALERGFNAGALAQLTNESSLTQTISRSGIQRLLNSDGENTPLWKVEALSEALKIQPEMLIKGVILKSRQLSLFPVRQGTDLRKLFSGGPLYSLEMITEPSDYQAQRACLKLFDEFENKTLLGGTQVGQMETNFRVRAILDSLENGGLSLFAARTMQVCPFTADYRQIGPDEWDADVEFTLVDENFIWDDAAYHMIDGSDLCDVLILKIDRFEQDYLTIEVNTDPANLVSPIPPNYRLIENMARLGRGIPLISSTDRIPLDDEDFVDETAKELFQIWKVEKEKRDAKDTARKIAVKKDGKI